MKILNKEELVCSEEDSIFYKKQGLIYPAILSRWKGITSTNLGDNLDYVMISNEEDEQFWNYIGPAYTASELSRLLPSLVSHEGDMYFINIFKGNNGWIVEYKTNTLGTLITPDGIEPKKNSLFSTFRRDYNLAKAMSQMLILLISNNLITIKELNT